MMTPQRGHIRYTENSSARMSISSPSAPACNVDRWIPALSLERLVAHLMKSKSMHQGRSSLTLMRSAGRSMLVFAGSLPNSIPVVENQVCFESSRLCWRCGRVLRDVEGLPGFQTSYCKTDNNIADVFYSCCGLSLKM